MGKYLSSSKTSWVLLYLYNMYIGENIFIPYIHRQIGIHAYIFMLVISMFLPIFLGGLSLVIIGQFLIPGCLD